jgi:Holliday junction resolvase RusA-like endonuclease
MSESDVQLPLLAEAAPLVVSDEVFCCFELEGEPRAWERPGATIRFGHGRPYIHWYLRAQEERYREAIAWTARRAMRGREPTSEAVALLVHAFLPIPPSWRWQKQQAARAGVILPTNKPDFDNLGKVAADAIKGIVWVDDAAVCDGRVIKRYSDRPALRVEVREMLPPNEKGPQPAGGG